MGIVSIFRVPFLGVFLSFFEEKLTLYLQRLNAMEDRSYSFSFIIFLNLTLTLNSSFVDGAATDLEDKEGRTPLHWAAVGGITDICTMLISNGVDVSKRDKLG